MRIYKNFTIIVVLIILVSISGHFLVADAATRETSTPTPTISAVVNTVAHDAELLPIIQKLFMIDDQCQYPCFWSLEPGQSTMEDVETFVHNNLNRDLTIGQTESIDGIVNRSLILGFNTTSPLQGMALNFTFRDGILSLLHIEVSYPENWLPESRFRISNLLHEGVNFGDIYIGVNASTGAISLNLISNDKRVAARYSILLKVAGDVLSPSVDSPLLLCLAPDLNTSVGLWLQNEQGDEAFDILASNPTLPDSSVTFYQPIEWMTGLETTEFISRIESSPNKCVEMLSYPELLRRGYGF